MDIGYRTAFNSCSKPKELDLMSAMTRLDKYRVLIVDDIGYVKKTDSNTSIV
ncbi:MAG: hypothetical protein IPG31_00910 [Nitrosomonas sp.]|nr:hypothetical protein [Nitrosomonas sp.]